DFYLAACERLEAVGIAQYEISNFARARSESRHNLKYWTRQPYLGFGIDAHSMLLSASPNAEALRFSTSDVLEKYVSGSPLHKTVVSQAAALEETFFLGLRLNRGIDLREISAAFGEAALQNLRPAIAGLIADELLRQTGNFIRLTPRGRLLSNEVFQAFLGNDPVSAHLTTGV
ncbi:MAG TPA: coproporphyrinogen III oxidase family protein, partial [Candidatus Sulfotelmatobacter sp.]|nr:coproporphyrinogen III oxidase family protein [Candidatus Sulfotelmatobacter sp.]